MARRGKVCRRQPSFFIGFFPNILLRHLLRIFPKHTNTSSDIRGESSLFFIIIYNLDIYIHTYIYLYVRDTTMWKALLTCSLCNRPSKSPSRFFSLVGEVNGRTGRRLDHFYSINVFPWGFWLSRKYPYYSLKIRSELLFFPQNIPRWILNQFIKWTDFV